MAAPVPSGKVNGDEAKAEIASAKPFRLLAIGDSLTEGYTRRGREFHPYTNALHSLLTGAKVGAWEIYNHGVSGETCQQIADRLKAELTAAERTSTLYDYIVILGGTNDVGIGSVDLSKTLRHLQSMYHAALAHGAHLLILNLPGGYFEANDVKIFFQQEHRKAAYLERQDMVHSAVDVFHNVLCDGKDAAVSYLDLAAVFPQDRADCRDDFLHLSAAGYEQMGQQVFRCIQSSELFPRRNRGVVRTGWCQTITCILS